LTTINVFVLIFHLILARTVLRVNWLPLSNSKRFVGALGLAASLSGLAGGIAAWCALYGHGGSSLMGSARLIARRSKSIRRTAGAGNLQLRLSALAVSDIAIGASRLHARRTRGRNIGGCLA
jgi:hypothetical protein